MTKRQVISALLLTVLATAGCGGTRDLTCDEARLYQQAEAGRRLEVPEGLDELDEFREIPLPEAAPRPERPPGSPCIDLPPNILGSG